jgi:hypothetical protein
MITLPSTPALNGASPALIDFGGVMRPPLGGRALKINRIGSRFRVACSLPPMPANVGRVFVSRLLQAKREGLRIKFPLLGVDQSGSPAIIVDGAGQAGLFLSVRQVTPGWTAREGFFFSIADAMGQLYLHIVRADATANGLGKMTIPIEPALRVPFIDGAGVLFTQPLVEGLVDGDEIGWQMSLAHHIGIEFMIEEAA